MQLCLETAELNVIANVLLEAEGKLGVHSLVSSGAPATGASTKLRIYEELLDKVLARDMELDSDELGHLADILAGRRSELRQEIAQAPSGPAKIELERKLSTLEPVLERIEEVCVMF